jgi:hypothetical protein
MDVSSIFWSIIYFLGLAVYHRRMYSVSFRNTQIMLTIGDEKVLINVCDTVHVKPLSRMYMLHCRRLVFQCAITVFPS